MSFYLLKDRESKRLIKEWLREAMTAYARDSLLKWNDEDALCEHFFSCIGETVSTPAGDLSIKSYKIRGRGRGAPEKKLGADGIGIVRIRTTNTLLDGFFLFQTKKAFSLGETLRGASSQCSKMLKHSAASYLLTLMHSEATLVGAMAVDSCQGADPSLDDVPYVGFPHFVVEQLLGGLMLESMRKANDILSPELRAEIKHIVCVVGSAANQTVEALRLLQDELKALGLEIESNED